MNGGVWLKHKLLFLALTLTIFVSFDFFPLSSLFSFLTFLNCMCYCYVWLELCNAITYIVSKELDTFFVLKLLTSLLSALPCLRYHYLPLPSAFGVCLYIP